MINKPFQKQLSSAITIFLIGLSINHIQAQGPNAPEASSFEPVDATDMVNLVTGDLSYVLPLLNVPSPEGGYPIALSYHAGIAMEQEASWVGLGWSLNPGAINRSVNGYPDDWEKTRVSELYYDEGGSTDYYSFSIGGTLPNGLTLGVSKSWGGYRAWGGVVGYAGQSFNFGSEGFGMGISAGPLSYYASSNGQQSIGVNFTPVGVNADTGEPKNLNGFGAGFSYDFGSNSISVTGYSKKEGVGISFNSSNGGSFSVNGNGFTSQSTSISENDYDIKTTNKGFSINAGFFWVSYRHTNVSYSLFKNNIITPSGILNAFDYRIDNTLPTENEGYSKMDIKEFYADDDNYGAYVHSEYDFSEQPAISFPNYDNYSVSGQGIGGSISPRIFDEITLVGKNFYDEGENYSSYDNTVVSVEYFEDNFINQMDFKLGNKINFYFDNVLSSFLRTNTGDFDNINFSSSSTNKSDSSINDLEAQNINTLIDNTYTANTTVEGYLKTLGNRKRDGNLIETFSNEDIVNGNTNGWFLEAKTESFDRTNIGARVINKVNNQSIGAYRITTPDGKVYHYSLPVYHFESIYKNFTDENNEDNEFFESKKVTPYATHWLLTAITGPDYVDNNSNGELDPGDYGYWVEFEYGRWSDGYGWKKTHKSDKNYFMGVKEMYYLDAIKTRTHTALFIKSIREDNKSTPLNIYNNRWTSNSGNTISSTSHVKSFFDKYYKSYTINGEYYLSDIPYSSGTYSLNNFSNHTLSSAKKFTQTYIDMPENKSLKLDKILILKNEDAVYDKTINNNISQFRNIGYTYHNYGFSTSPTIQSLFINPVTGSNNEIANYHYINRDDRILDNSDIEDLYLESKATKIVSFDYDYSLRYSFLNSPHGYLALKGIHTMGKSGIQLMPPYKFDYAKPSTPYNKNDQDVWGYAINNPDAWSLNKIISPTGGEIEVEYESDSFYAEAAYRTNRNSFKHFQFAFYHDWTKENILDIQKSEDYIDIYIDPNKVPNLSQYGIVGQNVYVDIKKWTSFEVCGTLCNYLSLGNNYTLEAINSVQSSIRFRLNELTDITKHQQLVDLECPLNEDHYYVPPSELLHCIGEISFYLDSDYFTSTDPNGKLGGGIRVKNVNVIEGANVFRTAYNYNNPVSNTISGITSYEPFEGENKTVPYIQEIPAPNVLYGNVCVSTIVNQIPQNLTKYCFRTLMPFNLSDNEDLLYSLGEDFKVVRSQNEWVDNGGQYENSPVPLSPNYRVYKHTIHNSLSNIGSLLSVKVYNSKNHLLKSTLNSYVKNSHIGENHSFGIQQESFKTYKRKQINYNGPASGSLWTERMYNIGSTSKINYPSVLENTTITQGGFTSITYFDKYDFLTGQVLETRTLDSKGNEFKTELIPAYTIYGTGNYSMGSKVDNPTNYNMLTQEAMTKTYMKVGTEWKETGIGITTWNNDWSYTDYGGNLTQETALDKKIWRKHKTFVWDGNLDTDGSYLGFTGEDDSFAWDVGQNVAQTNSKWKNISTTTLYDHYSMPLEVKDANDNYAATKMCDTNSKVLAVSNAAYTEMYYSGAEYYADVNEIYFDGQVKTCQSCLEWGTGSSDSPHTGKYFSRIVSGEHAFEVVLPQNADRTGVKSKFKVSVWARKGTEVAARVKVGGNTFEFNSNESVYAGNWVLLNKDINITSSATTVAITTIDENDFDDFRLYPAASTLTGYVYNEWDELSHIIDNNGLATKFEYDGVGRLIKTYAEVADFNGPGTGGFKPVNENNYNYKYN